MYKLIANQNYIKREIKETNNIQNDLLFLKMKERYKGIKNTDYINILNLIDDYFKKKTIDLIIQEIIDGCIFSIQNKDEQ